MKKIVLLSIFICTISLQAAQKSRLITDMAGREVLIPMDVKRVLTLGGVPLLNAFVMALGKGDLIINGLPAFVRMPKWKYQYVFAPHLKALPITQGKNLVPDIEKIIKAKPDVVITLNKASADILESKGIKSIVLKWRFISDVAPLMTLLGEVFNEQKEAKAYLAYFDAIVKKVQKITAKIPEDKKLRVLYTSIYRLDRPVLIAEWWLKTAGAISVSDDGKNISRIKFNIEQLMAWNPDVLIITDIKRDLSRIKSDKRFENLKAVKNNKIYPIPVAAHIWGHVTVEQPLVLLWALNTLYPKLYSKEELKKEVHYFYKRFFKTDLNKAQIAEILSGDNK